jgi:hypothetical protein
VDINIDKCRLQEEGLWDEKRWDVTVASLSPWFKPFKKFKPFKPFECVDVNSG